MDNLLLGPVCAVIVFLVVAWLALRLLLKPAVRRGLSRQLPLFGPIWAAARLSEFCQFLSMLLEGQLPLPDALRLTGEGLQDSGMDRACQSMAREVESGRPLTQAMSKQRRFPPGLSRLLGWAENQMALSEVLRLAGVLFETQARSRATLAGTTVTVDLRDPGPGSGPGDTGPILAVDHADQSLEWMSPLQSGENSVAAQPADPFPGDKPDREVGAPRKACAVEEARWLARRRFRHEPRFCRRSGVSCISCIWLPVSRCSCGCGG